MAPHSSTLAWTISWMEEPPAVHGVEKSRTRPSDFTFIFHFHTLEKEMATHFSVLAWRIPGTGEPGGLPSVGSHRVRHDWSDLAAAAAAASEQQKRRETMNTGEGTEKLDHRCLASGDIKWHSNSGLVFASFFWKENMQIPYDSSTALGGIYPREMKSYGHKKACMWMFRAALFVTTLNWK